MNTIETEIVKQYMAIGFPMQMSKNMAIGAIEKIKEQNILNVYHDLPAIIVIDNDVFMISNYLDAQRI